MFERNATPSVGASRAIVWRIAGKLRRLLAEPKEAERMQERGAAAERLAA